MSALSALSATVLANREGTFAKRSERAAVVDHVPYHYGALAPIPRWAALGTLLREGLVGVGVYQGMEFVLQRGMRDVAGQAGAAAARSAACLAVLARA